MHADTYTVMRLQAEPNICWAAPTASFLAKDNERNLSLHIPIVEEFVVFVDAVRKVLGILHELLDHASAQELAVRFCYAPVQLPNKLAHLWTVEEVNPRRSTTVTDRCYGESHRAKTDNLQDTKIQRCMWT